MRMIDGAAQIGESRHILVFQEGRSALALVAPIVAFGVAAISAAIDASAGSSTPESGAVVACLLMACMFFLIASRPVDRRIRFADPNAQHLPTIVGPMDKDHC